MKEKNNVFLMIIAVVSLIATVGGATYAYFASSITEGEGLNLDVTAESSTAQFTATGGNFGFTVTGADMQENMAGKGYQVSSTDIIEVSLQSESAVSCTYDIKFEWNDGSGYTPSPERGNDFEFGVEYCSLFPETTTGDITLDDISDYFEWQNNSVGEYICSPGPTYFNFDKITDSDLGYVAKGVKIGITDYAISNFGNANITQIWEITVTMYNSAYDQSALAGNGSKTYSGRFYVDNVVC